MILRARIVLPISRPPIADGAVSIFGSRVTAVGRWSDFSSASNEPVTDLGSVVLLPGLVNAHCHLDYTDMAGQPPPRQFPDWIKALLARKAGASYADYAQAWLRGAKMLLRTGTTTVGDIEAVPELLPDVWASTPLRVISFLELTGVQSQRPPLAIVQEAMSKIKSTESPRSSVALSPHALYSTKPELLRIVAQVAREHQWRVTMHVAESMEEFDMFVHKRGALFDWLKPQRDMSDCAGKTPVQQIAGYGLLNEWFLAVHANYLEPADIATLAESGSSVVHCPRSHAYFRHRPFPYADLATTGINICLGTDSLASVLPGRELELNLFTEMRTFAASNPAVSPEEILRMATMNGARGLGLAGKAGEIAPGAFADLIAVPFAGNIREAESAAVNHAGGISAAFINGMPAL